MSLESTTKNRLTIRVIAGASTLEFKTPASICYKVEIWLQVRMNDILTHYLTEILNLISTSFERDHQKSPKYKKVQIKESVNCTLTHDELMVDWSGRRREKHLLLRLLVAKILDE